MSTKLFRTARTVNTNYKPSPKKLAQKTKAKSCAKTHTPLHVHIGDAHVHIDRIPII